MQNDLARAAGEEVRKRVSECLRVVGLGGVAEHPREWAPAHAVVERLPRVDVLRGLVVRAWAPEFGDRKWVLKVSTKLVEPERGVWFSWKMHGICTPHSNRKYELIVFRGGKRSCPQFLEPRSEQFRRLSTKTRIERWVRTAPGQRKQS